MCTLRRKQTYLAFYKTHDTNMNSYGIVKSQQLGAPRDHHISSRMLATQRWKMNPVNAHNHEQ